MAAAALLTVLSDASSTRLRSSAVTATVLPAELQRFSSLRHETGTEHFVRCQQCRPIKRSIAQQRWDCCRPASRIAKVLQSTAGNRHRAVFEVPSLLSDASSPALRSSARTAEVALAWQQSSALPAPARVWWPSSSLPCSARPSLTLKLERCCSVHRLHQSVLRCKHTNRGWGRPNRHHNVCQ